MNCDSPGIFNCWVCDLSIFCTTSQHFFLICFSRTKVESWDSHISFFKVLRMNLIWNINEVLAMLFRKISYALISYSWSDYLLISFSYKFVSFPPRYDCRWTRSKSSAFEPIWFISRKWLSLAYNWYFFWSNWILKENFERRFKKKVMMMMARLKYYLWFL